MSSVTHPRKRWNILPPLPPEARAELAPFPALLAQILYHRGIRTRAEAVAFLERRWEGPSPFSLKGMGEAVDRIRWAIRRREPIVIYGDFDVDGITGTVILTQVLQALGASVRPYIPHRVDEGYDLNRESLSRLRENGARLVISVDCGIRSVEEVAFARQWGLDVIVTDHHSPGAALPPAVAVVNPKQPSCPYPFKGLSGVGVAYKVAEALLRVERQVPVRGRAAGELPSPEEFLDLVALGTVADIVPLEGENRTLTAQGLVRLNEANRPGVRALVEKAGLRPGQITTTQVGYILAPRLNAAGRIATATLGYELLATPHREIAQSLADELEALNRERQEMTREVFERARQQVEATGGPERHLLLVAGEDFHPGIVGLVASLLVEEYYRPSIVVEKGEPLSRGSARSIPEFHITQALDRCADLLVRHGGHAAAAGFTCASTCLPALEERLEGIAREALGDQALVPALEIDAVIPLSEVTWQVADLLALLEPFGEGNPVPLFLSRDVVVREARAVGKDGQHLRLLLSDGRAVWDAIAFHFRDWGEEVPPRADVVYSLEPGEWNGEKRLQLNVHDLRPAER
ncbi:MAG: single-stranded-DNA-specific exonuclease RecJ [Anaerolineae bacterium]